MLLKALRLPIAVHTDRGALAYQQSLRLFVVIKKHPPPFEHGGKDAWLNLMLT